MNTRHIPHCAQTLHSVPVRVPCVPVCSTCYIYLTVHNPCSVPVRVSCIHNQAPHTPQLPECLRGCMYVLCMYVCMCVPDVRMHTERHATCTAPVQINLSRFLTGLGDGSLMCPDSSVLGVTVARSDDYDRVRKCLDVANARINHLVTISAAETATQDKAAKTLCATHQESLQRQRAHHSQIVHDLNTAHTIALRARQEHHAHDLKSHRIRAEAALTSAQATNKNQAAVSLAQITHLNEQLATLKMEVKRLKPSDDALSFQALCLQGQAVMMADGAVLPGLAWKDIPGASTMEANCHTTHLQDSSPTWVHNRVRAHLREAWLAFKVLAVAITGWDTTTTKIFCGKGGKDAAILSKMLCYPTGADGVHNHGTFKLSSLLTGLLTSMPAQLNLRRLCTQNLLLARVLRKTIGPVIINPPHVIASAIACSGISQRQAAAVIKAAVGPMYGPISANPQASLQDLSKETVLLLRKRKRLTSGLLPTRSELYKESQVVSEAMAALFRPQATGGNGAHVDTMLTMSTAIDLMPGSVNVLNRCAHSAAEYRRASLMVAKLLKHHFSLCCDTTSPPVLKDPDNDLHHHVHVRLAGTVRSKVFAATGYTEQDWTCRSWSLSLGRQDFERMLKALFGAEEVEASLPAHLQRVLFLGTVPNGSSSMLLHQLDRMMAEMCEIAMLPEETLSTLMSHVPEGGGVCYATEDPMGDLGLQTKDRLLLNALRGFEPDELRIPEWPGKMPTLRPADAAQLTDAQELERARQRARYSALFHMLQCPEHLIMSIMFDGAKMSNGCLRKENVQTTYHVMFPQLQEALMGRAQESDSALRFTKRQKHAQPLADEVHVDGPTSGAPVPAHCRIGTPHVPAHQRAQEDICGKPRVPQRVQLTGKRSWWCHHVQTVHSQIPAGAVVGSEDDATVKQHILAPLETPLKLLGKWEPTSDIAPGLHFHPTPEGARVLDTGVDLLPKHLTCWMGRERTLQGEVPYLVVPMDVLWRQDMKAGWLLQNQGGHKDAEGKRCPLCDNKTCMQIGKAHQTLHSVLTLLPQETMAAAADRHSMWLWDVLRLNLEGLRNDEMIDPFMTLAQGDAELLAQGRQTLLEAAQAATWWSELDSCLTNKSKPPDTLRRKVEQDLGLVVLDSRDVGLDGVYIASAARHAQFTNTDWRAEAEESESNPSAAMSTDSDKETRQTTPIIGLAVVGNTAPLRPNAALRKAGLALAAVQRCCLHLVLCIVKSIVAGIWRDVNSMPNVPAGVINELSAAAVLLDLNDLTASKGLHWHGWHKPDPNSHKDKVSGKPCPSGRCSKWTLEHLPAIVDKAYPANMSGVCEKRQRMLELAKLLTQVLGDLSRVDWSPIPGMCWKQIPAQDLHCGGQPCPPVGLQVNDVDLHNALTSTVPGPDGFLRLSRSTVLSLLGPTCRLSNRSYVCLGGIFWGITIQPDPAEATRRANLAKDVKGLVLAWKTALNKLGVGGMFNGYYLHDLAHHIADLLAHAEAHGLGGLAILTNSVLEHFHQEFGKKAFQMAWVSSQNALQRLGRGYAARNVDAVPGQPNWESGNTGLAILKIQLAKAMSSRLCRGCWRATTMCPGPPICHGAFSEDQMDASLSDPYNGWCRIEKGTKTPQCHTNAKERIQHIHLGTAKMPCSETETHDMKIKERADHEMRDRLSGYLDQAKHQRRVHRAKERAQEGTTAHMWGISAAESSPETPTTGGGEPSSPSAQSPFTALAAGAQALQHSAAPEAGTGAQTRPSACECGSCKQENQQQPRLPCTRPNTCGMGACAQLRGCRHRVFAVWNQLGRGTDDRRVKQWVKLCSADGCVPWIIAVLKACPEGVLLVRQNADRPSDSLDLKTRLAHGQLGTNTQSKRAAARTLLTRTLIQKKLPWMQEGGV